MAPRKNGRVYDSEVKCCKKCYKVAQSGLLCANCGTLSHSGCLKQLKSIKYIDDETVICCEESVRLSDPPNKTLDSEADDEDPRQTEIRYLKKIINQNETIISNQQITINLLKEQLDLFKYMQIADQSPSTKQNTNSINHSNRDPNFERPKQSSSKIYPKNENTTPAKNVAVNESLVVDKERSSPTKIPFKNSTNKNKQVVCLIENNKQLSADILRIQTEAKCSDIINQTMRI
uniref:Uncharacterized protein LOC114335768 n=1 Tax=Diabrotica virgifera virgifera TaxID=50390 RepID=A0A6P7GAK8_DIAVI